MRVRETVVKQERSMVVGARVDVVELAEIARVFVVQRVPVKSMSHLIALIVSQMYYAMEVNGFIKEEEKINDLGMAWKVLRAYHLTTQTMEDRNKKKLNMSRGFENLRREGDDPEFYAPSAYKQLHNRNSVQPIGNENRTINIDQLVDTYHEIERKEREEKNGESEKTQEETIAELKGMTVEEYREYINSDEHKKEVEEFMKNRESKKKSFEVKMEKNRAARAQKELEEKARLKARKKLAKQTAECEIIAEQEEKVKKVASDDVPRPLTEEELSEKGKSIEERDIKLANMDMSAPKSPKK